LLEESGCSNRILRHSFARSVECTEIGAAYGILAVACLLKKSCCASDILLHAHAAFLVENAEVRAAVHCFSFASLAQESECANGIAFHSTTALICEAKTGTPFGDTAFACLVE
jgi:hypothetical protein